jgi:hypothetical protein
MDSESLKKEGEEWKASREGPSPNASCQGKELPKREAEAGIVGCPTYSHRCTRMHTIVYIHSETLCAGVYAVVRT